MANMRGVFVLVMFLTLTNAGKEEEKQYIQEIISTGREILGDGNCFYRCLSVYLYGHQNFHGIIREEIFHHMNGEDQSEEEKEERSHRYGQMMHDRHQSYEDYLSLHRRNGEWADDAIVQGAADLYAINIYVSSYVNSRVSQRIRATSVQLPPESSRLLHLRLEDSHYTRIEHDCRRDAVPSGNFVELRDVFMSGKQLEAEPLDECDFGVSESSESSTFPMTVEDDESKEKGEDKFNGFEDLQKKKNINKELTKKELENLKVEDLSNQFCVIDTEDEEPIQVDVEDLSNQFCLIDTEDEEPIQVDVTKLILGEDTKNVTEVEEKSPKQKFTRCRNMDHLKELCRTGQVDCGTECRVLRTRLGHEYHHYFMIWSVLREGLDVVHLSLTEWPYRICCEILSVSFAIGHDSLFDFQRGVFIVCNDFLVNETQIEAMRSRLEEMRAYTHIEYSLISKDKFYCQSFISYIKTGEKNSSEVESFVVQYPIKGHIFVIFVSFVAYLITKFTRFIYWLNKVKSLIFYLITKFKKFMYWLNKVKSLNFKITGLYKKFKSFFEFMNWFPRARIAYLLCIVNYFKKKEK